MSSALYLLGVESTPAPPTPAPEPTPPKERDHRRWIAASSIAGGVLGGLLWRRHWLLGILNGVALGNTGLRFALKDITLRRAVENLGAHATATVASLAVPSHPALAYVAGAIGANMFLHHDDTLIDKIEDAIVGEAAASGEMSPEQLAALDRALTPEEQKRVDEWQAKQADAAQKKEEATPYVDPKTGEKRTAVVKYEPGPVAQGPEGRPWWHYAIAGAVAVVVIGAGAAIAGSVHE